MTVNNDLRTCNRCGWVHFGVTLEYAEAEVARFNAYYYSLSEDEQRSDYGGHPSSITHYERCMQCGNPYTDFREAKETDCPKGVTLNPILLPP